MKWCLVALAGLLASCVKPSDNAPLEQEIANLKSQLEMESKQRNALERRFNVLEISTRLKEQSKIDFDMSDESYRVLKTPLGTLMVSIAGITPHADGSKLSFNIGNPNFVTFRGGKLHLAWNTRMPEANDPKFYDWLGAEKSRDVEFVENLLPGSWNTVAVTVPGTPPDKMGYLELTAELNLLSFRR